MFVERSLRREVAFLMIRSRIAILGNRFCLYICFCASMLLTMFTQGCWAMRF